MVCLADDATRTECYRVASLPVKDHSHVNESTYSAVIALDRLRRQLLDLYERYPLPAAPRGDYPPAAWREWREAAQHAYGVREGLLIAMTVGASEQTGAVPIP